MPCALALGWLAGEWLRGHLLTGFPWNLVASALVVSEPLTQGAAALGAYGLGAIVVALAVVLSRWSRRRALLAVAAVAGAYLGGLVWIGWSPARSDVGPDRPQLRLVQPDIPQTLKWDPRERERNLLTTIDVTATDGLERVTHVVWPESSTIYPLSTDTNLRKALARLVPPGGFLLAGTVRAERDPVLRAWNSLQALGPDGEIHATYDKFHLVPFGEYVPLRGILPLARLAPGDIDFATGPGPRTIRLPGLPPFSPLICYEIIFPGAAVDRRDRPDWILNVTNDAWFGMSAGPYQHLAAARLRAVEEGLPVVRVANGGISAIISAHGQVLASLPLGVRGSLDHGLPPPMPTTVYARFGDLALIPLALALLALGRLAAPARAARDG
jgi:apolipoprotein N-acyltransferase